MADQQAFFTNEQAKEFCLEKMSGVFQDPANVQVSEIGDGNLNYVWRLTEGDTSVIVKQAPPYIKCVGESWPLTQDRARLEAEAMIEMYKHCPEMTCQVLAYDASKAAMVLEDLAPMEILRGQLIAGEVEPNCCTQIAQWVARTAFNTSNFSLSSSEHREKAKQFSNPELCAVTDGVFFNDPYNPACEMNSFPDRLKDMVEEYLYSDDTKYSVARLKHIFQTSTEALIHGDLHSGSVFVDKTGAKPPKVFDVEFAFYGPVSFDLGSYIGNLLLNMCAKLGPILKDGGACTGAAEIGQKYVQACESFLEAFADEFRQLLAAKCADGLQNNEYQEQWIRKTIQDAYGFAGTEMIRRTVGIGKVDDVEKMEDEDSKLHAKRCAVKMGATLVCQSAGDQPINLSYALEPPATVDQYQTIILS